MKVTYKESRRSATVPLCIDHFAANHDQSRYIRASFMAMESVEGRPDGTLRPRLVIVLDARVWYASARTIARGKTRPNELQHSQDASEYLVRQVSYWRKAPATKHTCLLSDYEVARVYMNISSPTLNGSSAFFLSFLFFLTAFFISLFLTAEA
jgi:hypothetical protein